MSRVPVLVVLGATGVGKSKLAVQLAKKFGGEVISADSMQVYKGLDVITNKVTSDEMDGVPHHLLDFLDPLSHCTVVDFRNKALPLIDGLIASGKLPVVVGGTNYYIESLLWRILIEEPTRGDVLVREKEPDDDVEGILAGVGLTDKQSAVLAGSDLFRMMKFTENVFRKTVDSRISVLSRRVAATNPDDRLLLSEALAKNAWCLPEMRAAQGEIVAAVEGLDLRGFSPAPIDAQVLSMDSEPQLKELNRMKETNAFAALSSSVEGLCSDLRDLNEASCADVVDSLDRSVRGVEAAVQGRVTRVAAAVGLRGGADVNRLTSQQLHDRLRHLDPDMAQALHPNNRRKIIRSLQVLAQKGRTHSAILKEQRDQEGGSSLGGPLRYSNTAIFWLQCDKEVLNSRLDGRVDDMLDRGLVQELLDFHKAYNEERLKDPNPSAPAYTQGIFQSIGFKEFHQYLIQSDEERASERGQRLLLEGIEALKSVTRRYAKRQNKWVRNRFLKAGDRQVPSVYGLDTSDVPNWDTKVLEPAVVVVRSLMGHPDVPGVPRPLPKDTSPVLPTTGEYHCRPCQRVFIGKLQWEAHLASKKHQGVLKKKAREEEKLSTAIKYNQ